MENIRTSSNIYVESTFNKARDWKWIEISEVEFNESNYKSFIAGALSDAARDHHQKGLYTEEEVYEIARKCWRERGIVAQTYNMSTEPLLMVYFDKIKKK